MSTATVTQSHITSEPATVPQSVMLMGSSYCPICGSRLFLDDDRYANGKRQRFLCCISAGHEFDPRTGKSIRKFISR